MAALVNTRMHLLPRLLLAAAPLALVALVGCAGPDALQAKATQQKFAATVLGEPVQGGDIDELRYLVQGRLSTRFAASQGITVSADEVAAYIRHVDAGLARDGVRQAGPSTAEDIAARAQIATAFILQWKINRALHQRYGGRVAYQQGGAEPLDAWRRFLEDSRARGDLRLADPAVDALFWRHFTNDQIHSFYPPGSAAESQALSTPPWASVR